MHAGVDNHIAIRLQAAETPSPANTHLSQLGRRVMTATDDALCAAIAMARHHRKNILKKSFFQ